MDSPYHVILVDESTTICKVMEIALSAYEVVIDHIGSAAELSQNDNSKPPHVLIVDVRVLPEQLSASHPLAQLAHKTQTILLANAREADAYTAIASQLGATIINKPFSPELMVATCQSAYGGPLPLKGRRRPTADTNATTDGLTGARYAATPAPLPDNMPELIEKAVWRYCEKHFASIARQTIKGEIERLLDQKERQADR